MPSQSQVPLCLIHWFYSPKRNSPFLDRTLIFHNLTRSGYLFMPRNCLYPYPSFLSCLHPFWRKALFCVWAGAYNVFFLVSGIDPKAHTCSPPFTQSLSNLQHHVKKYGDKNCHPWPKINKIKVILKKKIPQTSEEMRITTTPYINLVFLAVLISLTSLHILWGRCRAKLFWDHSILRQ